MKKFIIFLLTALFLVAPIQVYATESATPSFIPFSQMEAEIDAFVNQYLGQTTPGVALAVVKDGEIIFSKGYGYADLENGISVSTDTVFEYASISKLFTWTSVMQLVEQRKLDLDEDVRNYLPDSMKNHLSHLLPFTMRDIMNHATGFGDMIFDSMPHDNGEQNPILPSLEEVLLTNRPRQIFKPGTTSAYSNYTSALAGYVVESIIGQPYYQYQRENIFNRIGVKNSASKPGFSDNPSIFNNRAQGYEADGKGGFIRGSWFHVLPYPAGSINGTIEDLARFAISLMPEPGEVSPLFTNNETLNKMLSPSYDINGDMIGTYHGFMKLHEGAFLSLGHSGDGYSGFTSDFAIVPTERFGIVLLTNGRNEMELRGGLHDLLISSQVNSDTSASIAFPDPKEVIGQYTPAQRIEGNFIEFMSYLSIYEIKAVGDNRISMRFGQYEITYEQTAPYVYTVLESNPIILGLVSNTLRFIMDDGKVTHISVGNGMDLTPLPSNRTVPFLFGSITIVLLNIIFFLLAPLVLLILMIKNKKQDKPLNKQFNRYQLITAFCGLTILLNNIICIVKIVTSMPAITFAGAIPHIALNYVISIIATIFIILACLSLKNGKISKKRKITFGCSAILFILLFIVLLNWNFFSFTA